MNKCRFIFVKKRIDLKINTIRSIMFLINKYKYKVQIYINIES